VITGSNDAITGGDGADTCVLTRFDDSKIMDFEDGTDRIELPGMTWRSFTRGHNEMTGASYWVSTQNTTMAWFLNIRGWKVCVMPIF